MKKKKPMSIFSKYYSQDIKILFNNIVPKNSKTEFIYSLKLPNKKLDYILIPNSLAYAHDVQDYIKSIKKLCQPQTRIVVVYFNFLWKPLLDLACFIGLREAGEHEPNWLSPNDISNLFRLEGFTEIKRGKRMILPIPLWQISKFINQFVSQLPLVNYFCLTTYQIFRINMPPREYSVSLIIPAKNEEGNIAGILSKIPKLGKDLEVIFVEGHSTDNTYDAIKREIKQNKTKIKIILYKQKGLGKGDAVRLGLKKAKNDVLIIFDADLSVNPKDLLKFYHALSKNYGEFANGSRLIYPMEKQAMRTLNYFGNKIFSLLFTFLLNQNIKDTLCGTKAIFRKDYLRIVKNRKFFGDFDPFGDFDLLFGATKLNLQIVEIPVRYQERKYGQTNISRFQHGWLLLKMTLLAAKKIKFI